MTIASAVDQPPILNLVAARASSPSFLTLLVSRFLDAPGDTHKYIKQMPAVPSQKERSRNAVVSCSASAQRPQSLTAIPEQAQKAHRERKQAYVRQLEEKLRFYEQQDTPDSVQERRLQELEQENAALRSQVAVLTAGFGSHPPSSSASPSNLFPISIPCFGDLDSAAAASDSASGVF